MLIYTMDRESEGGLRLEGIGNSGDSGGPALIRNPDNGRWNIGGVKSNGQGPFYGSENEYTRLGGIAYDWIVNNTKFDNSGNPMPAETISPEQCQNVWFDPSKDGEDWEEMFDEWDTNPKDGRIVLSEFERLYNAFQCSNETV